MFPHPPLSSRRVHRSHYLRLLCVWAPTESSECCPVRRSSRPDTSFAISGQGPEASDWILVITACGSVDIVKSCTSCRLEARVDAPHDRGGLCVEGFLPVADVEAYPVPPGPGSFSHIDRSLPPYVLPLPPLTPLQPCRFFRTLGARRLPF